MQTARPIARSTLHPLHAILLGFPIALFSAALASDIAYLRTAEMQWSNFSAWLIVGGLVFGGLTLAWGILGLWPAWRDGRRVSALLYVLALVLMWGVGLINAFQHSRDAWSSVGTVGLVLSIVSVLAAFVAGWIRHSVPASREISR